MNKTVLSTNPTITVTRLGEIAWNSNTDSWAESSVEMSEKNFKILLSLIPRTLEYQAVKNSIQRIKDKLTELNFKTTAEVNRDMLLKLLKDEYEYQLFISDIDEFAKNTPQIVSINTTSKPETIVGRINIHDCEQEILP